MKKLSIVLLIAAVALFSVGCGNSSDQNATAEPTAEPSTQLHTLPSDDDAPLEWAPVDCEITLESSSAVYAESEDFLTFALDGSTDEDCELRFTLDEKTASMLAQQSADSAYYLTVNGRVLKGTITLSEDHSELTLKGGYTYSKMCALASEIRGL